MAALLIGITWNWLHTQSNIEHTMLHVQNKGCMEVMYDHPSENSQTPLGFITHVIIELGFHSCASETYSCQIFPHGHFQPYDPLTPLQATAKDGILYFTIHPAENRSSVSASYCSSHFPPQCTGTGLSLPVVRWSTDAHSQPW